ncbi:MAG: hypothetical protein KAI47_14265 [Deltaproteobacteria bacterium]|nr:hypothetical protein [Deltaproteobacteria bacterium]
MSETQHEHEHSHSREHLLTCEACGARVPALRRGRCPFCYLRWSDVRPVGLGAACVVCGERRHDDLRSVEFQHKWVTVCHNCATKTFQMQPLPRTVEAIRQRLSRDRRWVERRVGRTDRRIFPKERRVGERRQSLPTTLGEYIDAADLVVEIVEEVAGMSSEGSLGGEATRIAMTSDGAKQGDVAEPADPGSEPSDVSQRPRTEDEELEALAAELAAEEAAEEVKVFNEAELAARARGDVFEDEEAAPEDDDEILVAALGGLAAGASEDAEDAAASAIVVGEIVVETTRPRSPRPPTGSHLII